jgi:NAD(P)-dependent dehydrogenase (short-subunit alcohol dehydrogenase family)
VVEPDPSLTALFTLRSLAKATSLESILSPSSQKYRLMPVDMSSLESVRDFASSLSGLINSGSLPHVRAIVCAAAVMHLSGKRVTEDGMEATFQVNYLANVLLIMSLLPVMRWDCRIIFLTSNMILAEGAPGGPRVPRFDEYVTKLPDPVVEETGKSKAFAEGTLRYATSKVLLSMFAAELQRRLDASDEFSGINVVLLDPGTFASGMLNGRPSTYRSRALARANEPWNLQNILLSSGPSQTSSFHFFLTFPRP